MWPGGRAGVSRPAVWRWQRRYAEAGRRSAARQDASAQDTTPFDEDGRRGVGTDMLGAAGRGHALDRPCRGPRCRDLVMCRAADLERSPPPAARAAHVQAIAIWPSPPRSRTATNRTCSTRSRRSRPSRARASLIPRRVRLGASGPRRIPRAGAPKKTRPSLTCVLDLCPPLRSRP